MTVLPSRECLPRWLLKTFVRFSRSSRFTSAAADFPSAAEFVFASAALTAGAGVVLALPVLPAHAKAEGHYAPGLQSIRLTATPPVVRADGHSTTYINAEVYDDRGDFVPDGTRVRFSTTGGAARLDTGVATTKNGVARVFTDGPLSARAKPLLRRRLRAQASRFPSRLKSPLRLTPTPRKPA